MGHFEACLLPLAHEAIGEMGLGVGRHQPIEEIPDLLQRPATESEGVI